MHLFLFPHYILVYIALCKPEMGTIFTPKWVPIFSRMGTHQNKNGYPFFLRIIRRPEIKRH